MSAVPPGGKPTSQRIGPDGQVWAAAAPASHTYNVSAAANPRIIVPPPIILMILANFPKVGHMKRCLEKHGPHEIRAGNRFSASSQHELHRDEEKALMSDDITFDKNLDLVPGHAEEVVPGVRRVLADNGGPFTFKGTLTYIVGKGKVAIVDPGPDDANHIKAVLDAVRGATVTHIFVTHTHRDHSPAV